MKSAFRIAALFAAYTTIGFGSEYAVALLFAEAAPEVIEVHQVERVEPVVAPTVVVDVKPTIVSRIQIRHEGECSYTDEREVISSSANITAVHIQAGAGALHVEGQEGLEQLVLVGLMCASTEDDLQSLHLSMNGNQGGPVTVVTEYPPHHGQNTARIDLTVLVPLGMDVEIDDSSGDITVTGTGDLDIDDSSGSIHVSSVLGSVVIDDSSGSLTVEDIVGDTEIDDGSGSMSIRRVQGTVSVDDGAGGIEIVDVGQDVLIESDGAGSITVTNVGGDFVVDRDGAGSIRHSGVEGNVEVPVRRRRGGR